MCISIKKWVSVASSKSVLTGSKNGDGHYDYKLCSSGCSTHGGTIYSLVTRLNRVSHSSMLDSPNPQTSFVMVATQAVYDDHSACCIPGESQEH